MIHFFSFHCFMPTALYIVCVRERRERYNKLPIFNMSKLFSKGSSYHKMTDLNNHLSCPRGYYSSRWYLRRLLTHVIYIIKKIVTSRSLKRGLNAGL